MLNLRKNAMSLLLSATLLCSASLAFAAPAELGTQVLGDLNVVGSMCVGDECNDSADFGFDTLRLQDDVLRIHFQDTSSTASFPTQDWRIIANDSAAGGEEFFSFSDGNDPFGYDFRVDPSDNVFHITSDRVVVGRSGDERIISNVREGALATDAATVGQLNDVSSDITHMIDSNANAGAVLASIEDRLNVAETAMDDTGERLTTAKTAMDQLASQSDTLTAEVEGNRQDIDNNSSAINDLDVRVETNRTDIAQLMEHNTGVAVTGMARASVSGEGSTALGTGASARTRDTAVGANAKITADGSVAVGANSQVDSQNSVALGADSFIASNADGAVAVGQDAKVVSGATGSVALGQNSIADQANTVSVGSADNERRITHVASAVNKSDVVNLGQLQEIENKMQAEVNQTNHKIDKLDNRLDKVAAMTSAFSALVPNPRAQDNTQISLGLGHYSGSTALAAGVFHQVNDNILVNTGVSSSFSSNATAGRAGITFGW